MLKEYVIQFYKTVNKLLCNLSFVRQYILTVRFMDDLFIDEQYIGLYMNN